MTMLMVTHDLNLKNFADRVIWMRDGKISRIEEIPKERRLSAIFDLNQRLGIVSSNNLNSTAASSPTEPTANKKVVKTEIRKPGDYEVLSYKSRAADTDTDASKVPIVNPAILASSVLMDTPTLYPK